MWCAHKRKTEVDVFARCIMEALLGVRASDSGWHKFWMSLKDEQENRLRDPGDWVVSTLLSDFKFNHGANMMEMERVRKMEDFGWRIKMEVN